MVDGERAIVIVGRCRVRAVSVTGESTPDGCGSLAHGRSEQTVSARGNEEGRSDESCETIYRHAGSRSGVAHRC